jgi:DNA-binding PucR family transcriptional regulator
MRCPSPGRVTRFEDVELLSLVSGDDEAMVSLVRRELGPLAADDPATARLRATLGAVQAAGGGSAAAADALGVHRNTVLYRLRRIDELLGRPAAERRLELEVALRLAEAFPDRVLVPAAEVRPVGA